MPAVLADDDPEWITITPPTPPPPPRSIEPVKPVEHLNAIPLTAPEGVTPEKPRIGAGFENDHAGPGFVDGVFDAALEAVRQWELTPTLLNGVPVPVIM